MHAWHYTVRDTKNLLAHGFALLATAFGLFWLAWILWTTLNNGLAAIHLGLFTQMTPRPGATGGLRNAFFGSVLMSLWAWRSVRRSESWPEHSSPNTRERHGWAARCASSTTSCCRRRRSCWVSSSTRSSWRGWGTSRRLPGRFRSPSSY